jgi:hypothetical protein
MNITNDSRLTDSLERELLAQAFDNQYRLHPVRALLSFIASMNGLKLMGLRSSDKAAIAQMV